MTCHGDRGSGCSRPGRRDLWIPPQNHWANNPQTGEQLYQRISCTAVKVLGPTTDFSTWGFGKEAENPQGIWLWRSVGWDYRISSGLGKQTLGGHKQNLVCTGSRRKEQWPQKRLGQASPGISGRGVGQQWPWITALSNSIKLWAMPCRATHDEQVTVESSNKTWSTGEGNANHFGILTP